MTRINFYQVAGAADSALTLACKLTEKAWLTGIDVLLYSTDFLIIQAVGRHLWGHSTTSFLAHDDLTPDNKTDDDIGAIPASGQAAAIGICGAQDPGSYRGLLINLDIVAPPWFGRFDVLAEILYDDDDVRAGKRERYRFYKDRGYPLNYYDLTPKLTRARGI